MPQKNFHLFLIPLLVFIGYAGGEGPAGPEVDSRLLVLSEENIYDLAVERARQGNYSRISQIDIVECLFLEYEKDERVVAGEKTVVIAGPYFARAQEKASPYFKSEEKKSGMFEPAARLPEIQYQNFKGIGLSHKDGLNRMSIKLKKDYTQEIPYTFGASIRMVKEIKGTVRADRQLGITEVVFDTDRMVSFFPPSFVFFIPKMHVKIASIRRENGEIIGYVIGSPMNMPQKFCAVRYNLTSCSKTSIKSLNMSLIQFNAKLNDVSYYAFSQ